MVHALQEAGRVTRSMVVDIRPRAEPPEVWVRNQAGAEVLCGGLSWKGGEVYVHGSANEAVQSVLDRGLFKLELSDSFEWLDSFESTEALVESVEEDWDNWTVGEETALKLVKALGPGAEPFIRQGIQVQVLRSVSVER
jgi:hypothetical protein